MPALLPSAASLLLSATAIASCRTMHTHEGVGQPPERSISARLVDTSITIPRDYARGDTSLRAAVVRQIAASWPAPVRLNPVMLPASLDVGRSFPTATEMQLDPGGGVARVRNLTEVAFAPGDSQRLAALCVRTGPPCPRDRAVFVRLGIPRHGGPERPKGAASLEVKPTYWTVRVIAIDLGSTSSFTKVADYVFEKTAGGWEFVRVVGLFSMD